MKAFISQPMRGKTKEEIKEERERLEGVAKLYGATEIIDSYFEDFEEKEGWNTPISYLSASIDKLAEADIAVFAPNAWSARGCAIERRICEEYGIPTVEVNYNDNMIISAPNVGIDNVVTKS